MTGTPDGFAAASQALLQLAERERDFHDLTWRQHMQDAATYLERLAAPTRAPHRSSWPGWSPSASWRYPGAARALS